MGELPSLFVYQVSSLCCDASLLGYFCDEYIHKNCHEVGILLIHGLDSFSFCELLVMLTSFHPLYAILYTYSCYFLISWIQMQ